MPELKWNEYDVIECLGVLPEIDETWHRWHKFKIVKDNLILKIELCEFLSVVLVELSRKFDTEPLFNSLFFVRGEISFHNEKNFSSLRLNDCLITFDEYSYSEDENAFNKNKFSSNLNFDIYVFPNIKLKFS